MEKIEKFVRKYLRNKLSYDEYVMKILIISTEKSLDYKIMSAKLN